MTPFECYKLFLGLHNHFTKPSYDYFTYGPSPVKLETFLKKPSVSQYRFERLSKKFSSIEDLEQFIVANLIESQNVWDGSLSGAEADERYLLWQGRIQALQYRLRSELKRLVEQNDCLNCLFTAAPREHPEILKALMRSDMSLESFVVLDMCINFFPRLNKTLSDDHAWVSIRNRANKYRPFIERLNISVQDLRQVLLDMVRDLGVTT